jgi:HprK-related kinase A
MRQVRERARSTRRPHCADCRIGEINVRVRSDLKQVLEDFAQLYPSRKPAPACANQTIDLEVRRAGRSRVGRRLYRVWANGTEIGGWRPSNGVFPLVEWGVNLGVIATRPEYLQLHAASLAHRGYGFIFAGDSGAGKSTLACILLAHGWHYLCDEFALVDARSLRLHPFPKAICIKAGSYRVIRELGLRLARRRDYLKELKGRVGYINPVHVGADRIGQPSPTRFVVFPSYREGAAARLEPIPRGLAAMNLYRCCFNKRTESLDRLTRLVGQAACYRLQVGRPRETVEVLESLCDKLSSQESPASVSRERLGSATSSGQAGGRRLTSRRELLRTGARLAYVAPTVLTLSAHEAFAAGSNPSNICSTALNSGELCQIDSDCCSKDCDFGVCQ